MNPKVSIIILNWNGKKDTLECLDSLKKIKYPNYEVILVDNGSIDGSVECFKQLYPGMEIIENHENLGFAEGNNVGIRRAMENRADYVLLLNNDTVVDPKLLEELVKVGENDSRIGVISPKISSFYNSSKISVYDNKFDLWTGNFSLRSNLIEDRGSDNNKEVDHVTGCCMLVQCKVIEKVGLLNPDYFLYWEETDWCFRIRKAEYKIIYAPKAKIWHKISSSSGSNLSFYYFSRNLFLFMKKNATFIQILFFLLFFFTIRIWIQSAVILLYRRNISAFSYFLKGTKDGLKIFIFNSSI